jgi:hypothetical protein
MHPHLREIKRIPSGDPVVISAGCQFRVNTWEKSDWIVLHHEGIILTMSLARKPKKIIESLVGVVECIGYIGTDGITLTGIRCVAPLGVSYYDIVFSPTASL